MNLNGRLKKIEQHLGANGGRVFIVNGSASQEEIAAAMKGYDPDKCLVIRMDIPRPDYDEGGTPPKHPPGA